MEHTRLGRTGLKVSRLCLGTMTFGNPLDEPGNLPQEGFEFLNAITANREVDPAIV